jgi:hypothetical protein
MPNEALSKRNQQRPISAARLSLIVISLILLAFADEGGSRI